MASLAAMPIPISIKSSPPAKWWTVCDMASRFIRALLGLMTYDTPSAMVGAASAWATRKAAQRFIEQNDLTDELQLAGSVCGDGPYDPMATLMYYTNQYNEGDPMSMPVVLPLILKGMCDYNPYMKDHQVSDYLKPWFLNSGILDWLTAKEKTTNDITAAWKNYFGDNWPLKLNQIINEAGLAYFQSLYSAYSDTYTSEAGIPLPEHRGLMEDLHFALASNNLTKGWTPQHALCLYHSRYDTVVPEVNRESAGNSFPDWVLNSIYFPFRCFIHQVS